MLQLCFMHLGRTIAGSLPLAALTNVHVCRVHRGQQLRLCRISIAVVGSCQDLGLACSTLASPTCVGQSGENKSDNHWLRSV